MLCKSGWQLSSWGRYLQTETLGAIANLIRSPVATLTLEEPLPQHFITFSFILCTLPALAPTLGIRQREGAGLRPSGYSATSGFLKSIHTLWKLYIWGNSVQSNCFLGGRNSQNTNFNPPDNHEIIRWDEPFSHPGF